MAHTVTRKNRRRSRLAGLAAAGSATALLVSGIAAPPAQALVPNVTAVSAGCMAGDSEISDSRVPGLGSRPPIEGSGPMADCTESEPSWLAWLGDGALRVVGIFVPDLDLSLQELNGAAGLGPGSTATVSGRGLNVAVGGGVIGNTRGVAHANARNTLSGAVAVGALGGDGYAESLVGLAIGVGALDRGAVGDANALPGGLAIAISSERNVTAAATALGGFALASNTGNVADRAICTAVYATADLGNGNTCTSILFLFQQYETGDGTTHYAIKNPLSLRFSQPVTGGVSDSFAQLLEGLGLEAVGTVAGLRMIPEFRRDLIRVSVADDGSWNLGTDLFTWLRGLLPGGSDVPELPDVFGALGSLTDSVDQAGKALDTPITPLTPDEIEQIQCDDAAGTPDECPESLALPTGGSVEEFGERRSFGEIENSGVENEEEEEEEQQVNAQDPIAEEQDLAGDESQGSGSTPVMSDIQAD